MFSLWSHTLKNGNLEHHCSCKHAAELDEYALGLSTRYWAAGDLSVQQATFTTLHSDRDNVMQATFVVSGLIATKLKPHSEGEFVK